MKRIVLILSIALFTILFGCTNQNGLEKIDKLTILHLQGNPYEIGLNHGRLLKNEIDTIIVRWKKVVEENYDEDFKSVLKTFFKNTTYVEVLKKYCPELLEEVHGISQGSGIDYETILAFQMSEEIETFADDLKNKHCTAISINHTENSPTFLAQNMDPPLFLHGCPVLLHITNSKTKLESYIYTFPGFIGLNGLNSKGVGIACNSVSMLNASKKGLPVAFIVRSVLNQTNEQQAFNFIRNIPIGIPQCFTIGGIDEARCFECSANEIKEFYPFKNKNITLHTNFAAANRDFNQHFIDVLAEYGKTINDPYFCPRYFLAYDKIKDLKFKLDYEGIKSILSLKEPVIEPISNENTYGSLIMMLSKDPVLYIAPGRPDSIEYIKLKFSR